MNAQMVGVVSVKPLDNHRLRVSLSNGKRGVFDALPYLDFGVFSELKNPAYFAQAKIEPLFGGILWPHGQDISPEKIAGELQPLTATKPIRRAKLSAVAMNTPLVKIVSLRVLDGCRLRVALSDGRRGVFDALPYLDKGIFRELKDPDYFSQVKTILNGTGIEWPNGQDLSADTIEHHLQPAATNRTVKPIRRAAVGRAFTPKVAAAK